MIIKTRPIPKHDEAHKLRDEKEKGPKPVKGRGGTKPQPHRQGKGKR